MMINSGPEWGWMDEITDKIDNNKQINKFNSMSKTSAKVRYTQLMEWLPTVKKKQTTNKQQYNGSKRK